MKPIVRRPGPEAMGVTEGPEALGATEEPEGMGPTEGLEALAVTGEQVEPVVRREPVEPAVPRLDHVATAGRLLAKRVTMVIYGLTIDVTSVSRLHTFPVLTSGVTSRARSTKLSGP